MADRQIAVSKILKERKFVKKLIDFGFHLLGRDKNKRVNAMRLLLKAFKYEEIFYWKEAPEKKFDTGSESNDISLIKYASETLYLDIIKNVITKLCDVEAGKLEDQEPNEDISLLQLMDESLTKYYAQLNQKYTDNKFSAYCESKEVDDEGVAQAFKPKSDATSCMLIDFDKDFPFPKDKKPVEETERKKAIFNILQEIYCKYEVDEQNEQEQDDEKDDEKEEQKSEEKTIEAKQIQRQQSDRLGYNNQSNKHQRHKSIGAKDGSAQQSIGWIEIAYASIVETFSALDFYTDVLILLELYAAGHMWWSTFMLTLQLAPYLVSHGSLVTLLQNKINFYNIPRTFSFFLFFLSTPVSLIYLFMVDMIFMVFSVVSTLWFLILVCALLPFGKFDQISRYDIGSWIDDVVFEKWLNMNKTEIIGYRRLRTLSQLFFETIPQIILQARMLGDASINTNALFWSIGLALCHLLLEAGIIYLDSHAFEVSFLEYSILCLGGRIQWIPFQHRIPDICKNQFKMLQKKENIDAVAYKIPIKYELDDTEHHDIIVDYEDIRFIKYHLTYQFATQSIQRLIGMLRNSPNIIIPEEFKLTSTNIVLQTFMKHLYCAAEIRIGRISCGHIDLYEICQLIQASTNKMRVVLKDRKNTIQKLKDLTTFKKSKRDPNISQTAELLINHGFIQKESIQWLFEYDDHNINAEKLKLKILDRCLPSGSGTQLRLDLLRNCYHNNRLVGTSCEAMEVIQTVIDEYYDENICQHDNSLYFVIIFMLSYSK
eukprot:411561_1